MKTKPEKKQEEEKVHYQNIQVTNLPNSEVEITGEIKAEIFEFHRAESLKALIESAEIEGFRKGHAPESMVLAKYSEAFVLEKAAGFALDQAYYAIISDNSIKAIGDPQITITKIAKSNPLGFKIKTSIFPDVNLPDYKSLAKKINKDKPEQNLEATEEEIEKVLKEIQQAKAHESFHAKEGDTSDHNHDLTAHLDELNDEFAKKVGDFANLAELKSKIKENLEAQKKLQAKEKVRISILDALVTETKIELPELMIDAELGKMLAQFKNDVAQGGLTFEMYLEHVKKTEADVKKEWREIAIKRAKSQVILGAISKEEDLKPVEEDVKKEIDNIVAHSPEVDRFRARMFVENMMQNEKVLEFLEGIK
jgi:FKBP-type peptidyl-prolyl cis-trans isomerase (trigger factor)